ncbi:hypothetical protein [Bacillus thuringiensis]|uniref:hypothetical protein n=1 Tax=Bacillus thuringiensis TaxID=1428 RepID=UPI0011A244D7|nr:hypothetical protein [Bacillus thuringiensis]
MNLDGMKELIKQNAMKRKQLFTELKEPWNVVRVYYGTTSKKLNDILQHGIIPQNDVPSNPELVSLTTKWHYWYAFQENQKSLIETVGQERYESESITSLWNETGDFPIYISFEVPKEILVVDENVVHQLDIKKKIQNGDIESPDDISLEDCLEHGMIASIDTIQPWYIDEVNIIGSEEYRADLLDGAYGEEANLWFKEFENGSITADSLNLYEQVAYGNLVKVVVFSPITEDNPKIKRVYIKDEKLQIDFDWNWIK